ncbi:PIN-like domain-containing protein [Candidatus Oscillochloris fontis]|uniref:PIN-like domain-containing protein n=1 Tax=Candidatus Oscillochloris fontis TaxID=2496868 RepID=UPI00101BAFF3|nr:PIN-like domain-containing protein [Candidatus Oscillochloris fontis]
MKSLFPGYFQLTEEALEKMWHESTFVFDTNVLLHLYRYSEETRSTLLGLMKGLETRIWMPRKVAHEFFDNRLDVLGKQISEYDKTVKKIQEIVAILATDRQHPFIENATLIQMRSVSDNAIRELEQNKQLLMSRLVRDEILKEIGVLFENKVGEGFIETQLEEIYNEGKARHDKKVPPGYIDAKEKASSNDNYRIYGDLIIWKEMIERAKTTDSSIIFVSDDKKEDWWLESHGRKISPQPQLIQEFQSSTQKVFYIYTIERFIEFAGKFLASNISTEVIQEVRDIRVSDEQKTANQHQFRIITESELVMKLSEYEGLISEDPESYVGLKHFITSVLAKQGYEINHSYAVVNNLINQGVVDLSEKFIGRGLAKVIALKK